MALSVLPGRSFAISAQRFPNCTHALVSILVQTHAKAYKADLCMGFHKHVFFFLGPRVLTNGRVELVMPPAQVSIRMLVENGLASLRSSYQHTCVPGARFPATAVH
jgi:hypothetical protein